MLKVNGIDHINMQVRDLEQSIRFWHDLFGFELLEAMPEHNGAIIGCPHALLALYENKDLDLTIPQGFSHFGFHIDNFDEVLAACQALGIKVEYDGEVQWPKSKSIYLSDPNGYEIELTNRWGGGLM